MSGRKVMNNKDKHVNAKGVAISEKDQQIASLQQNLKRVQRENYQLHAALDSRRNIAKEELIRQQKEKDDIQKFERSKTKEMHMKQLAEKEEQLEEKYSLQIYNLRMELTATKNSLETVASDRNELTKYCEALQEKTKEFKQLQTALQDTKENLDFEREEFAIQLAEKEDNYKRKHSKDQEMFKKQLSEQTEWFQKQTNELTLVSQINELSQRCVNFEEKVAELEKAKTEFQCVQTENNQLQVALQDSNQTCDILTENFTKQLAERDEIYRQELSKTEENVKKQLSEQEEQSQNKLSDLREELTEQLIKKENRYEELVSERDELRENCGNLEERVINLEKVKTESQRIQTENNQLQTALQESSQKCGTLTERFTQQLEERGEIYRQELSQRDEIYSQKLSKTEENAKKQLSKQDEQNKNKLSDLREKLTEQLTKKEKQYEELVSERDELHERCGNLEEKVEELEDVMTEFQMENDQIQTALEDSNRKCKTTKEKFAKQQAEIIKLHKLELLRKEDSLKKQLSEQEEEFQKKLYLQTNKLKMQLMKIEKILKEVVSERDELTEHCMNLEKKVEKLENVKIEFQCVQTENNQLQTALEDSQWKCDTLTDDFTKQLAEKDEIYSQEISNREDAFKKRLSKNEEEVQKQLTDLVEKLNGGMTKRDYRLKEVVSERDELTEHCVNLEEKVAELEKVKTVFQCMQMENNQLQTALEESNWKCDALSEEFTKQLAQRDEIYRQELSKREETFNKQLLEQEEESKYLFSDRVEKLMDGLTKTEIRLKQEVSEKDELFELCVNWEAKTADLEEREQKLIEENNQIQTALEDRNQKCNSHLDVTKQLAVKDKIYSLKHSQDLENLKKELSEQTEKGQNQLSDLREKEQKLHCLMEENNQLQTALQDSKKKCDTLTEKFTKQLALSLGEIYKLKLSKTEESLKKEPEDEILQNEQEVQQLMEENNQQQELAMEKQKTKKKEFHFGTFFKHKKTADH